MLSSHRTRWSSACLSSSSRRSTSRISSCSDSDRKPRLIMSAAWGIVLQPRTFSAGSPAQLGRIEKITWRQNRIIRNKLTTALLHKSLTEYWQNLYFKGWKTPTEVSSTLDVTTEEPVFVSRALQYKNLVPWCPAVMKIQTGRNSRVVLIKLIIDDRVMFLSSRWPPWWIILEYKSCGLRLVFKNLHPSVKNDYPREPR